MHSRRGNSWSSLENVKVSSFNGVSSPVTSPQSKANTSPTFDGSQAQPPPGGWGSLKADHERVLVYVRVKPPLLPAGTSISENDDGLGLKVDSSMKQVTVPELRDGRSGIPRSYHFDGVFGPETSQEEVYRAVGQPVLETVLKGYDGTVLAYGQTGSGKTHSLLNYTGPGGASTSADDAGLVPRLVANLFVAIAADYSHMYQVHAAFLQVYNEQIDDLLQTGSNNLRLRESPGGGSEVEGLQWLECKSPEALMKCFQEGGANLRYSETYMNKHSSRSHAVLQIKVIRRERVENMRAEEMEQGKKVRLTQVVGRLTVADLAGSERVKRSGSEGARLREATNINTSLLCFGNVVSALATKQRHIPFRDSKLTRLLENMVGGRSKTSLLVCISPQPADMAESVGSLEFGARAMRVDSMAEINRSEVLVDASLLINDLSSNYQIQALEEAKEQKLVLQEKLEEAWKKMEEMTESVALRAAGEIEKERSEVHKERERANAAELSAKNAEARLRQVEEVMEQQLASMRAQMQEEIDSMAMLNTSLSSRCDNVEREVQLKDAAQQEADSALQSLNEKVERLMAQEEDKERALIQMREELTALEAANKQLAASLVEAEAQIGGLGAQKVAQEAAIAALEQSRDSAMEEARLQAEQVTALTAQLVEERSSHSAEMSERIKDRSLLEEEIQRLHASKVQVACQMAQVHASLAQVVESLGAERDAAQQALGSAEQSLSAAAAQQQHHTRETLERSQTLCQELRYISTLATELKSAAVTQKEETEKMMKAHMETLATERGKAANTHSSLAAEITALKAKIVQIQKAEEEKIAQVSRQHLQAWLSSGFVCTKYSRGMKPYSRLARLISQGKEKKLEWASLGPFKRGVILNSTDIVIAGKEDEGNIVVHSKSRDIKFHIPPPSASDLVKCLVSI